MSNKKPHPVLLLVSAPSGAGKTTLCQQLLQDHTELKYSISCTTRPPRPGEEDGVHYHFLTRGDFEAKIAEGAFLEHADVYGNLYGTLIETVLTALSAGDNVLMDVDVQGAGLIRDALAERGENDLLARSFLDVFISPPSLDELRVRLVARGQDADDVIERRMQKAAEEMTHLPSYAYSIVNENLADAVEQIDSIYRAATCRTNPV